MPPSITRSWPVFLVWRKPPYKYSGLQKTGGSSARRFHASRRVGGLLHAGGFTNDAISNYEQAINGLEVRSKLAAQYCLEPRTQARRHAFEDLHCGTSRPVEIKAKLL